MANTVKNLKKKGKRLKRTIRKTLGTLFLVSALVVAAIPVDYLQADEVAVEEGTDTEVPRPAEPMKVTIGNGTEITTKIPNITDKEFMFNGKYLVYSSAD